MVYFYEETISYSYGCSLFILQKNWADLNIFIHDIEFSTIICPYCVVCTCTNGASFHLTCILSWGLDSDTHVGYPYAYIVSKMIFDVDQTPDSPECSDTCSMYRETLFLKCRQAQKCGCSFCTWHFCVSLERITHTYAKITCIRFWTCSFSIVVWRMQLMLVVFISIQGLPSKIYNTHKILNNLLKEELCWWIMAVYFLWIYERRAHLQACNFWADQLSQWNLKNTIQSFAVAGTFLFNWKQKLQSGADNLGGVGGL